jgi:hypothetical protein
MKRIKNVKGTKILPSPCAGSNFVLAADRVAGYSIHDILVKENTRQRLVVVVVRKRNQLSLSVFCACVTVELVSLCTRHHTVQSPY